MLTPSLRLRSGRFDPSLLRRSGEHHGAAESSSVDLDRIAARPADERLGGNATSTFRSPLPAHRFAGLDAQFAPRGTAPLPRNVSNAVNLMPAHKNATPIARADVPEQLLAEHVANLIGGVEVTRGFGTAKAGVSRPAPYSPSTEDVDLLPLDALIDSAHRAGLSCVELRKVERAMQFTPGTARRCGSGSAKSGDQRDRKCDGDSGNAHREKLPGLRPVWGTFGSAAGRTWQQLSGHPGCVG